MGLYDRDYARDESASGHPHGDRSMVVTLILINVGVWLADVLFTQQSPRGGQVHVINDALALGADSLLRPWEWWRLLTAGFLHNPLGVQHILCNMLGLYVLGSCVEERYNRQEMLRIYLMAIVISGAVWAGIELLRKNHDASVMGASGGVSCLIVLAALNFPQRTILLMWVLPVPLWAFGVLVVAGDIFGSRHVNTNIAYSAHLAGAAFGFLYYWFRWNFSRFAPSGFIKAWRRPKLRVHAPLDDDADLGRRADKILEKISQSGEASLSRQERDTLEAYSRRLKGRKS